jgi:hypothetical protein
VPSREFSFRLSSNDIWFSPVVKAKSRGGSHPRTQKSPARFPARAHFLSFYFPILGAAIRVNPKK